MMNRSEHADTRPVPVALTPQLPPRAHRPLCMSVSSDSSGRFKALETQEWKNNLKAQVSPDACVMLMADNVFTQDLQSHHGQIVPPCVADGAGPQCRSCQQHGLSGASVSVLCLSFHHSIQLQPVQSGRDPQQEQVVQPLLPLLSALEQQLRVRIQSPVPLRLQEAA